MTCTYDASYAGYSHGGLALKDNRPRRLSGVHNVLINGRRINGLICREFFYVCEFIRESLQQHTLVHMVHDLPLLSYAFVVEKGFHFLSVISLQLDDCTEVLILDEGTYRGG